MLVGNAFRLDATHPYKPGPGHDFLLPGNGQELAKHAAASPKYSQLVCLLLVNFWFKGSSFGPISKAIAAKSATRVDITMGETWNMRVFTLHAAVVAAILNECLSRGRAGLSWQAGRSYGGKGTSGNGHCSQSGGFSLCGRGGLKRTVFQVDIGGIQCAGREILTETLWA